MNREIKFRAWGKKYKQMYGGGDIRAPLAYPDDDIVLMQYTGLLDRFGVKIYEGDVVKAVYCHLEIEATNYEIVFDDDVACFAFHRRGAEHRFRYEFRDGHEFEVIGNIHENPELIAKGGD
jgi:uncharacterized phage protein (TIGR01671 family)